MWNAAFYRCYNPRKVSQAVNVLKSYPLYPTRDELNKTLRRQYGEDLDTFGAGKTKANWLALNHETQVREVRCRERKIYSNITMYDGGGCIRD